MQKIILLLLVASAGLFTGCGSDNGSARTLVVYASQDQIYAEPILAEFERLHGVRILPLFDAEASKTVGLANRLMAERRAPRCDVFWSNEELRMRQMAAAGVLARSNAWKAFGYRSRRLAFNTNRVHAGELPATLAELTQPRWRGRLVLAYPLFGTTATHFQVLRQTWGRARWERWCADLVANAPKVVDGNSAVVRLVGRGEADIGLTDSDDIRAGERQGLPIASAGLGEDTLAMPNAAGIVSPVKLELAAQLVEYLSSENVVGQLVSAGALEGSDLTAVSREWVHPTWDEVLGQIEPVTVYLQALFLR